MPHPILLIDIAKFTTLFRDSTERAEALRVLETVLVEAGKTVFPRLRPGVLWPRHDTGDGWIWPFKGETDCVKVVRFALAAARGLQEHAARHWEALPLSVRFVVAWGEYCEVDGRPVSEAVGEANALLSSLGESHAWSVAWTSFATLHLEPEPAGAREQEYVLGSNTRKGRVVESAGTPSLSPVRHALPPEQGGPPLLRVALDDGSTYAYERIRQLLDKAFADVMGTSITTFEPHGAFDGWYLNLEGLASHQDALDLVLAFERGVVDLDKRHGRDLPLRVRVVAGTGRVRVVDGHFLSDDYSRLQRYRESREFAAFAGERPFALAITPLFHVEVRVPPSGRGWAPLRVTDKHGFPHDGYVLVDAPAVVGTSDPTKPLPPPVADSDPVLVAGQYRVTRILGAGGYGAVWEALDERLHRKVALKRLERLDAQAARRFQEEGRIMAGLDHPNVLRIWAAFEDAGSSWLVLELCDGGSLEDVLKDGGPLDPRDVADAGLGILAGLEAIHALGIVHRDVKPENILYRLEDRTVTVCLGDFGVAHQPGLHLTGSEPGTPAYKAPEILAGAASTPRSDLYALGATLWRALTGEHPTRIPEWRVNAAGFRASPPALAGILAKALSPRPEDRYPDAREMAEDLRRYLASRPSA